MKSWRRAIPITIEDRRFEGPHGTIGVRVYTPDGDAGAGLVWAHGGAFCGGDIDMPESDWVAQQFAERGIAVVHAELPPMTAELAAKVRIMPDLDAVGAEAVRRMNLHYVRDPAALREPYAFPGGHDLSGLPPTFILNADIDSLRASGQQYGAELATAAVDVVMIREDGAQHGHLNDPGPLAVLSVRRIADWLLSPALLGAVPER